jgi:hypothetical protein
MKSSSYDIRSSRTWLCMAGEYMHLQTTRPFLGTRL